MSLAEPAAALTDLALGSIALGLALGLYRSPWVSRHWARSFAWAGSAAVAGFVHHGWVKDAGGRLETTSWALISLMVVVAVSYILAGTVVDVLGPGHARTFWVLRSAGLVAYAVLAALGHPGILTMLACEGITMACVIWLWVLAARRDDPRARPVLWAIAASIGAAIVRAAAAGRSLPLTFDADALYHVAQVPGLLMLFRAVRIPARRGAAPPPVAVGDGAVVLRRAGAPGSPR
ncbi:MAG: hypothetical protein MUE51_13655 [Thermoleophilia bacterium]|nr:hypothetical protein [Thermoleophilia bacterium]